MCELSRVTRKIAYGVSYGSTTDYHRCAGYRVDYAPYGTAERTGRPDFLGGRVLADRTTRRYGGVVEPDELVSDPAQVVPRAFAWLRHP